MIKLNKDLNLLNLFTCASMFFFLLAGYFFLLAGYFIPSGKRLVVTSFWILGVLFFFTSLHFIILVLNDNKKNLKNRRIKQ